MLNDLDNADCGGCASVSHSYGDTVAYTCNRRYTPTGT